MAKLNVHSYQHCSISYCNVQFKTVSIAISFRYPKGFSVCFKCHQAGATAGKLETFNWLEVVSSRQLYRHVSCHSMTHTWLLIPIVRPFCSTAVLYIKPTWWVTECICQTVSRLPSSRCLKRFYNYAELDRRNENTVRQQQQ